MAQHKHLPTIWEVPDDLWERIREMIDEYDPPKQTGRPREDARKILDALIFKFRTGRQWNRSLVKTLKGAKTKGANSV